MNRHHNYEIRNMLTTQTATATKTNASTPVEVFCRIKPLLSNNNEHDESCVKILDNFNLLLDVPQNGPATFRTSQAKKVILIYSFNGIFDESAGQEEIFNRVGVPLVKNLLAGENGLLFTYGVTGSGKTYSLIGNQSEYGIIQLILDTLFNSISFKQAKKNMFKPDKMNSFEMQSDTHTNENQASADVSNVNSIINERKNFYTMSNANISTKSNDQVKSDIKLIECNKDNIFAVFLSCVEIYNNYIYDLLDNSSGTNAQGTGKKSNPLADSIYDLNRESKNLKEDANGSMYIKDATEIEIKSTQEALDLIDQAQKRRMIAFTDLNTESSRSHSIFTIRVVQINNNSLPKSSKNKKDLCVSQLSFVDLASSERAKRTPYIGTRLREAGNINASLLGLRTCIEILKENARNNTSKIIPYRGSKLTLLFKKFFEGNGQVKMIACINPSSVEFEETINVLKFGDLVKEGFVNRSEKSPELSTKNNVNINDSNQQLQVISERKVERQQAVTSKNDEPEEITLDTLNNANLRILANIQKNNFSLLNENQPPLDVFSSEDDVSIKQLIEYLEEFQNRRDAVIQETESLKQLFYVKLRELNNEFQKMNEDRNEYKTLLDQKFDEQKRYDIKIKALENLVNANGRNRSRTAEVSNVPVKANYFQNPLANNSKPKVQNSSSGTGSSSSILPLDNFNGLVASLDSVDSNSNYSNSIKIKSSSNLYSADNNQMQNIVKISSMQQQKKVNAKQISTTKLVDIDENDVPIASSTYINRSSRITQTTTTTHSIGRTFGGGLSDHGKQIQSYAPASQPQLPPLAPKKGYVSTSTLSSRGQLSAGRQENEQSQQSPVENVFFSNEGIPVANRRAKRRSKSAEQWLDHRPAGYTKMDAIMQPKMNRKRSVTRVELKDAKKSSKYLLTHQQQDEDGELITNLIKGDVIKSPTGGRNVIFTDIETLKIRYQDIPKPVKRYETNENVIERRIRTEERCAVGIEGHVNPINMNNYMSTNRLKNTKQRAQFIDED